MRKMMLVAAMIMGLMGCNNSSTPLTGTSRWGQPDMQTGTPVVIFQWFQLISLSPQVGSTIRNICCNGVNNGIDLVGTYTLPKELKPSWIVIAMIHEDGSDGKIWPFFQEPYEAYEAGFHRVKAGVYVQHVDMGDYGSFAAGHTVNAMFFATERNQWFGTHCLDDPRQICVNLALVKYKQFIPLDYKWQDN